MGPEDAWWNGMWILPVLMPIVMLIAMLVCAYFIFGRGCFTRRFHDSSRYRLDSESPDNAMEILKKRYARGELSREEFERMRTGLS